jgi:hypothetical protein
VGLTFTATRAIEFFSLKKQNIHFAEIPQGNVDKSDIKYSNYLTVVDSKKRFKKRFESHREYLDIIKDLYNKAKDDDFIFGDLLETTLKNVIRQKMINFFNNKYTNFNHTALGLGVHCLRITGLKKNLIQFLT